jgi:cell division inhibitor SulA/protein ImuA
MLNRAETLEQLARLCRREGAVPPAIHATGSAQLDAVLPHGGWQSGTIVELMPTQIGVGEFRLLMPALASITAAEQHVALVSPPYIPFAPALSNHGVRLERLLIIRADKPADILWALEQTLRCKSFGAVIGWPTLIKDRDTRRLQLAAEAGRSVGFLYRTSGAALESSPAAVRLRLRPGETDRLNVDVLKCRGTRGGFSVNIGWDTNTSLPHLSHDSHADSFASR